MRFLQPFLIPNSMVLRGLCASKVSQMWGWDEEKEWKKGKFRNETLPPPLLPITCSWPTNPERETDLFTPRWRRCGSFSAKVSEQDESVDTKSQTPLITVCLTLPYCYPIILDTFFVYFGQLVLFVLFLFLFFLLSLIIIIIIVSITSVRGQLLVISCKKYVRYKWSCCCCYEKKKKHSPCPTHHFFPKTGLPRHKPLHRFSFRGDNNREFKWSARLY